MKTAPVPANEHKRLKTLHEYGILDTIQEADFDDITRIAAEVCRTPISLVSIIDAHRQWFKSRHGLITSETSRDFAFCAHAISNPEEVFIIPDTSKDERFHDTHW
jgi:GAF domain-containing protein